MMSFLVELLWFQFSQWRCEKYSPGNCIMFGFISNLSDGLAQS